MGVDLNQIKIRLANLSAAKIVSVKTGNPDIYELLLDLQALVIDGEDYEDN